MTSFTINELNRASLVTRFGNSPSIALLDPACEIFTLPEINGAIGYRKGPGTFIVFGEPVCSDDDRPRLTENFHQFAKEKGKRVIYATTSAPFAKWSIGHVCGALIEVGEELIVDPQNDPSAGSKGRIIRKKLNHSGEFGVTVKEYIQEDKALENQMEAVGDIWLKSREGLQIFLSHVNLFLEREGKRYFYALHEGKMVGVLLLNRLDAQKGWLVNLLMITPDAPNGTSERLIVTAIEALRAEGCRFLSFGVTPTEKIGEIVGLGRPSAWLARTVFKTANRFFGLVGRRSYWLKFQPKGEPAYVLFSGPSIGVREVFGMIRAFNVGL